MKIRKTVRAAMEQLRVEKLRPNQLKPINRILDGKDTLLIAATSFGKSLVAQIPAVVNRDKLTIIIEPLTALMHEQVEVLQALGIAAGVPRCDGDVRRWACPRPPTHGRDWRCAPLPL